jgi:putative transposase
MGLYGAVRGKADKNNDQRSARSPCPLDRVNRRHGRTSVGFVTWTGFVYLAFVIDAFARRIVSWRASARRMTVSSSTLWSTRCTIVDRFAAAASFTHSDQGVQGGFKRSSQHDLCRLIGETGQAPLRVSSNQASFGAAS